jgi:hypothetical protein
MLFEVNHGTGAKASRFRRRWLAAAAPLLGLALLGAWVLHPNPSSLGRIDWIAPAPAGDWLAVSGPARWRRPVFLENNRTGEFLRIPAPAVISPDGSTAAWSESRPGLPQPFFTPRSVSLSDPGHPATAWETKDLREEPLLVFSPDARRLAIIASDRVVVWNTAGGMAAAARPPRPLWEDARGFTGATFAGDDVLKIYAMRRSAGNLRFIDLLSFDVRARTFRRTGTAGPFSGTFPVLADAARDRILVREKGATIDLLDGETGKTLKTFGKGAAFRAAAFLSDGGMALFESDGGAGRVVVLSAAGEERRRFPVGPADRAWLLGESRPGTLVLAAGTAAEAQRRECRVLLVDLATGAVRTRATGVVPAAPYASALSGDFGTAPEPGSLATRLFFTPQGALVELEGPGRTRRIHPR